jgi:Transglycosylase
MSKTFRKTNSIVGLFWLLLITGFSWIYYSNFYVYQSKVDHYIAHIPRDEQELSPVVFDVLNKTETVSKRFGSYYYTNVRRTVDPTYHVINAVDRNVHELTWMLFLPRRIGKDQMNILFCRFAFFGSGQYSLKNAAKFYFEKEIKDLNADEVLVLLTIASEPGSFRKGKSHDNFYNNLNAMVETYHKQN